jgi:alkanesulfonate monooxygenase SsuD/methylene tetrahydromethanopterin reductase-like flavin-dependent oxidoreductase (luciferase family)
VIKETATAVPRTIHPWVAQADQCVRFGIFSGPAHWTARIEWVREVERLGFDSFWLGDHTTFSRTDCWTALAVLARETERVRLGPLVSCVYYRSPALLARQAADVDQVSGGRLVLGLGIGDIPKEFTQLGLGDPSLRERDKALVETIQFVSALWRGETVTMHGSYVHADETKLGSLPVQEPYVPILIAGGGERRTLRRVAQHADACNFGPSGATGSAWALADVTRKLDALRKHCADAGRPYDSVLRTHASLNLIAAETEAALDAKLTARHPSAKPVEGARGPGMPRLLTTHYGMASMEDVPYVIVAGTPPQLIAYYRALVEAGMRYFIAGCGSDAETIRLLAQEVMPKVA